MEWFKASPLILLILVLLLWLLELIDVEKNGK